MDNSIDYSVFQWAAIEDRLVDAVDEFVVPVEPPEPWRLAGESLSGYLQDELDGRPHSELIDAESLLRLLELLHVPLDLWASPAHADPTFELLGIVLELVGEIDQRARAETSITAARFREQVDRAFDSVVERRRGGCEFDSGMSTCVGWLKTWTTLQYDLNPQSDCSHWLVRDQLASLANAAEALRDAFRVLWWRHEPQSTEAEIDEVSRVAEHGWRRSTRRDLGRKELSDLGPEDRWDLGGG